jgi:RNA polymerase sigma factor (sigma-70 family)
MTANDLDLLEQFAQQNSQDAFAEIVRRHLDLVYSAALRQVRSPQLAEEIAQSVFADLARDAGKLKPDTILTAWLYAVTRRTAIDVIRKESRRRLREQIAVEMNDMNATATEWAQIEPLLDDAMAALDETDRNAILLRYFENKSLHEVGAALGASEDAAQKRVSRAVERLRDFFSKRNVTIGASGLVVLISTYAVQAAPAALAVTISAAALAGTAVSTSTAIAVTKTIAMTTLQKSIIGAVLVAAVGTGVFEARQAAQLQNQIQTLQQQQAPLPEQIQQLQRQRDDATNQLAELLAENEQLKSNQNETNLLKLRSEIGMLRQQTNELGKLVQAWQNASRQNSPVFPTNFFPMESLQFLGRATPEAALESALWAKSVGNEKIWLDGMAPAEANGATNSYVQGKSDAERSQFLINQTKNWTGFQILSEIPLADDEVIIQAEVQAQVNGTPHNVISMEVMKKIDDEWKLYDEYNDNGLFQPPQN